MKFTKESKIVAVIGLTILPVGALSIFASAKSADKAEKSMISGTSIDISRFSSAEILEGTGENAVTTPTVVVFTDYQCGGCAQLHQKIRAIEHRGSSYRFVTRNCPLSFHTEARRAAVIAEAFREQGKLEPIADLLFASEGHLSAEELELQIKRLGIDRERLRTSLKTTAVARVESDLRVAAKLKLLATPTMILCEPGRAPRVVTVEEVSQ